MKLTTKSEYALLAMIFMARHAADGYIKADQIATAYDIPKKYLEQLLMVLKQHRFIKAKRGAAGGYALARDAEGITLAEIIRLMDGALAPVESVSTYFFSHTPLEAEPGVIDVFRDIRDYISDKLETITLTDLI
jgi:Rrf2 family transcriptional regulator, cysteine metabolism repressor